MMSGQPPRHDNLPLLGSSATGVFCHYRAWPAAAWRTGRADEARYAQFATCFDRWWSTRVGESFTTTCP